MSVNRMRTDRLHVGCILFVLAGISLYGVFMLFGGRLLCRLAPCDAVHLITVENHQPQTFRMSVGGRSQPDAFEIGEIAGCTIKTFTFFAARPEDQPIVVMASDAQGQRIISPEQMLAPQLGVYRVSLTISGRSDADCPSLSQEPTPS